MSFFNSIFIHRYKDTHPEVRAKCAETIGKLVMEYSTKFLDNQYLKYVGWALYDKSTDVRIKALEAIDNFYQSKNLISSLEPFLLRFRSASCVSSRPPRFPSSFFPRLSGRALVPHVGVLTLFFSSLFSQWLQQTDDADELRQ